MSAPPPSLPVPVTGTGLVCGAGGSVAEVWEALETGRSAVAPYRQWDGARWPVKLASEVQLDKRTLVPDRKLHKSIGRTDMLGIYAADRAIEGAALLEWRESLEPGERDAFNDRTGIVAGSGGGCYHSNYDYFPLMAESGGDLRRFGQELGNQVSPMWLLKNLPNNVLCHVGIRAVFKGVNACVTNQCAGGILAATEAAAAIRYGEADRVVAVGHDAPLEPEMVLNYHRLGLMSGAVPKPFDRDRDGTVFGEGAASLVLESEASAAARGAEVLGEFLGSGCCNEAAGVLELASDGEGVARAIELALADAGLAPGEVGMICAHGNGTPASDRTEALGIRRVFGEDIPPVTAFKWAYGHLIAASGAVDLVMTLEALRRGVVPGVPTLENLDPGIAPFPAGPESAAPRSNTALVICRGFGSVNVVAALRGA